MLISSKLYTQYFTIAYSSPAATRAPEALTVLKRHYYSSVHSLICSKHYSSKES